MGKASSPPPALAAPDVLTAGEGKAGEAWGQHPTVRRQGDLNPLPVCMLLVAAADACLWAEGTTVEPTFPIYILATPGLSLY